MTDPVDEEPDGTGSSESVVIRVLAAILADGGADRTPDEVAGRLGLDADQTRATLAVLFQSGVLVAYPERGDDRILVADDPWSAVLDPHRPDDVPDPTPDGPRALPPTDSINTVRRTLPVPTDEVRDVAFSPDGRTLASGGSGGIIRLWDLGANDWCHTICDGRNISVLSLAFSPDSTTLAAAGVHLTLWDLASRRVAATLECPLRSRLWAVVFSPDGTILATGNGSGVVLWDTRTYRVIAQLDHTDPVIAVAFSPDGALLAGGGLNRGDVQLWDVRRRRRLRTLHGHTATVHALAFSPDGHTLASGGYDRTIRLWDARTDRNRATLKGHTSAVSAVAFNPDGTLLASGGASASFSYPDDHTVRLWDPVNPTPMGVLTRHRGTVSAVAFHPCGSLLASGSFDTTVQLAPIDRSLADRRGRRARWWRRRAAG